METRISSAKTEVVIGHERSTVLIGERINPTGKKRLSEALKAYDLEIIRQEALTQVQAGADIIDVNVSIPGVDEITLLPKVVQIVMGTIDAPLCLDSPNPEALEAALKVYKGKPLINSVTGEEHSMAKIFPLVKEYGAAVVGLLQDESGVPDNSEQRIAIAHKIIERAEAMGIPREDIIIDGMALAMATDNRSALAVMDTIRQVKAELGVNLTLGASNISFGLPDRNLLTGTFVAIVIATGITCLIADAAQVRPMVLATELLLGRDNYARHYIRAYRQRQQQTTTAAD